MRPVLLLNADYKPMALPFSVTSAEQAMNRIVAGSCYPVIFYDSPIRTKNQENLVRQLGFTHWPSVIATKDMKPRSEIVGFNVGNLIIRDRGRCRYCGVSVGRSTATLDHYVPVSRGGKNTWNNAVLACGPCNSRKGSDMPVGEWKLEVPPHEPSYKELVSKARLFPLRIHDERWLDYLPSWYGPVILAESGE